MEPWICRVRGLLRERGSASTQELVEELMGRTSGNLKLASKVVCRALESEHDILRLRGGRWVLDTAMDRASAEKAEPLRRSSLLLLDDMLPSTNLQFGWVWNTEKGYTRWNYFTGRVGPGLAGGWVCQSDVHPGRRRISQQGLCLLAQGYLDCAWPWHTGRRIDLRRLRRILGINALACVLPLRPTVCWLLALPGLHDRDRLAVALELNLPCDAEESLEGRMQWWGAVLERLQVKLAEQGVEGRSELLSRLSKRDSAVDLSGYEFDTAELQSIPEAPGTYSFWTREGSLLYIGKSRNLRRRIRSYFGRDKGHSKRKTALLERLYSLEYHCVGSEIDALIEETQLIESMDPQLNVQRGVRSRRSGYFADHAAIAVFGLPGEEETLDLWCLRPGRSARNIRFESSASGRKKVRTQLERFFFRSLRRPEPRSQDAAAKLLAAWLHRYRDSVNWIDVERVGTVDDIMNQLSAYARDSQRLSVERIIQL